MAKCCPFLIIAVCSANPQGGVDCLEEGCQLWDVGLYECVGSGCGLVPRENRKV